MALGYFILFDLIPPRSEPGEVVDIAIAASIERHVKLGDGCVDNCHKCQKKKKKKKVMSHHSLRTVFNHCLLFLE